MEMGKSEIEERVRTNDDGRTEPTENRKTEDEFHLPKPNKNLSSKITLSA